MKHLFQINTMHTKRLITTAILAATALMGLSSSALACGSNGCNDRDTTSITTRSTASSYGSLTNTSPSSAETSSQTKAAAVSFGAFAMAPLPAGLCDSTNPEYKRFAIPFLFDASEQKTNSLCPKIHMREYLVKTCQYADARQLDKAILSELIPNFQHNTEQDYLYVNLSPAACEAKNQPVKEPASLEGSGIKQTPEAKASIKPNFKPLKSITKKKDC